MLPRKWTFTDMLSRTSSEYLRATLSSYFTQLPVSSSLHLTQTLPKGYHFLYFNPQSTENELSFDGYDSYQSPPVLANYNKSSNGIYRFKRRMWVSGELKFFKDLLYNQEAKCIETISRMRKIGDSTMVSINRDILTHSGELAITEKRALIYPQNFHEDTSTLLQPTIIPPAFKHTLTPSDILLFRYSALTFNSHKIHYDKQYAITEGYKSCIVHGPLCVTLVLEWIQRLNNEHGGVLGQITKFKYKNTKPLFVDEPMTLCLVEEMGLSDDLSKRHVWIENHLGETAFKGEVEFTKGN